MEYITIKHYAASAGVSYEAVRQQVKRFENQLNGHIRREGKYLWLDEDAVRFLDERRNDRRPVELVGMNVPEIEAMQAELIKAKAANEELREKIIALYEKADEERSQHQGRLEELQAAADEAKKLLTDSRTKEAMHQVELEGLRDDLSYQKELTQRAEAEAMAAKREADQLRAELERRKWWQFWK